MRDQITTAINDQFKTVTSNVTESNERVLDAVVDVNRKFVDFVVKTAEQAPSLPVDVPFADRLPTPAEAGERYFEMVERLVELNRDFNERVVKMLPADVTPKPAAAPKAAAKPAAKKTTARKTTAKKATAKKATTKKAAAKK